MAPLLFLLLAFLSSQPLLSVAYFIPRPLKSGAIPASAISFSLPEPVKAPASHHRNTVPHRQNRARKFLDAHNRVRSRLGEPPLAWDWTLAQFALRWSKKQSVDCQMVHSQGPYGENLFWGSGKEWTATDAVESWGGEEVYYSWERNECSEGKVCGHYTQIAWNSTERVGCARVKCTGGNGLIITCNYDPPGNLVGERPLP